MPRQAPVTVRIEPEVKSEVKEILSVYGMTMSEAINIYLHMIIRERGLPFDLRPRKEAATPPATDSAGDDVGASDC